MSLESLANAAADKRYPELALAPENERLAEVYAEGFIEAVSRITPEQVEELLNSEVHGPMSSHDPRDGSCQSCPWPLHELPPADVAAAIVALYRGVQQPNEDDEGGQEA